MSSSNDEHPDQGQQQQQPQGDGGESRSGEGADSALAHMKSQNRQHRRQAGEDDHGSVRK